ncbi:MAG TPA: hypothetical protein VMD48_13610 [Solirubrobacteraceae bacterium]|nr:hypothetical protein [Solirubrobacteraceae bacterium]
MSTLALAPTLFDRPGGEPSLDDVISSVWEVLTAREPVGCPLCGEAMRPRYVGPDQPISGRCSGCGSTLS